MAYDKHGLKCGFRIISTDIVRRFSEGFCTMHGFPCFDVCCFSALFYRIACLVPLIAFPNCVCILYIYIYMNVNLNNQINYSCRIGKQTLKSFFHDEWRVRILGTDNEFGTIKGSNH